MEEEKPTDETLRTFIQMEWADLHHSRVQEWTALGVVAGVHVVLIQAVSFLIEKHFAAPHVTISAASAVAASFAVFGILITLRHRHLMNVKLHWISQAEERLGLVRNEQNDGGIISTNELNEPGRGRKKRRPGKPIAWKGLAWPRPFSTGGLLIGFYVLLIAVDVLVVVTMWLARGRLPA